MGIRAPLPDWSTLHVCEQAEYEGKLVDRKFVDSIADVLAAGWRPTSASSMPGRGHPPPEGRHERRHPRAWRTQFPDRILGTPISENAFVGLGAGMAMDGRFRPVVEFMYPDFLWVAADQVFNQAGKARHMFGGELAVPLVLRTKVRDGQRLRLAAPDGPGRHLRDGAGLADHRPFDAVRLRRA